MVHRIRYLVTQIVNKMRENLLRLIFKERRAKEAVRVTKAMNMKDRREREKSKTDSLI